jgi:hypothetical protein
MPPPYSRRLCAVEAICGDNLCLCVVRCRWFLVGGCRRVLCPGWNDGPEKLNCDENCRKDGETQVALRVHSMLLRGR